VGRQLTNQNSIEQTNIMKFTQTRNLAVAILSLTASGLLYAADTSSSTSLNESDQAFVATAALSGKAEVQVSELAVKKGESSEVKAIAVMIVKDHQAVNAQIADLAKAKSLALTSAGDPDADKTIASLEQDLTGNAFDRAYLNQVQKSHKASIAVYAEAASAATDPEVKAWAGLTVVALRAHLDRIDAAIAAL
jgi:putative membrane protein